MMMIDIGLRSIGTAIISQFHTLLLGQVVQLGHNLFSNIIHKSLEKLLIDKPIQTFVPPQTSNLGSTKQREDMREGSHSECSPVPIIPPWGDRCDRHITIMMVMMRVVGIVHVIAMRTTPLRVPSTLVGIPVRHPPEIESFHFQEDLQMNNRGQIMMVFGVEVEPIVAVGGTSPSLRTVLDASDARGPHGSDDGEREDRNSPDRSRKGNRSSTAGIDTTSSGSLQGEQQSKNKENQGGKIVQPPTTVPSRIGEVAGETAFQKREPSHHTPMKVVRRPLG